MRSQVPFVVPAVLALATCSFDSLYAQALPTPVHWYRGDGDATDSIGGVHGAEQNGASYAPGLSGNAFSLDGLDDYVVIPAAAAPTGDFSVEAWVQYASLGAGNAPTIASNGFSNNGWRVAKLAGANPFVVFTQTSGGSSIAPSATTPTPGPWYHVVVTFADWTTPLGTISMYVDGVLENSVTIAPVLRPTYPVWIGAHGGGGGSVPDSFHAGLIDELRIYDSAISASEVAGLYAAGAGAPPACGPEWQALPGPGTDDTVFATAALPGGGAVIGGDFLQAGGVSADRIARFDGSSWQALGTGVDGSVHDVVTRPNGNVIAGGTFTIAGGVPVANVAEWNGTSWQALGPVGANGNVRELAVLSNGNVVAGGNFTQIGAVSATNIARFDGSAWNAMTPAPTGEIDALLALPNDDLLAAGRGAAAVVRRWNGSTWTMETTPLNNDIRCMVRLQDGDLVVGGTFTGAPSQPGVALNRVARWDGTMWQPVGTGIAFGAVYALETFSGVEVLAGGNFTIAGGVSVSSIARWDGASWHAIDGGLTGVGIFQECWDLATLADQAVLAGGAFTTAGVPAIDVDRVARLHLRCPPIVEATAPTCTATGASEPARLFATSLPKAGTTYSRTATGLPVSSLVFGMTSIVPAAGPVPLSFYGPSPAGCDLLVNPVVVELVSLGGTPIWNLIVPADLSFVGLPLQQQLIAIEISGLGSLVELTSTNRLTSVLGSF
ncbi:MAG: LamG domain-containing protein [Planctomycetes bacterium]|nr:LamG domain-containing protein [Planctomycetota bacterium]